MKTAIAALLLLIGATSITLAQSQPVRSHCFGEPYSGSAASRCNGGYHYHHYHHHHHHPYS
jgi:hypothetical protein